VVQSRATGYVEKLYVRATLDPVAKGQRLVTLYVPDWAGALTEYLALRKAGIDPAIVTAARERLRLLSVPDETVARAERDAARLWAQLRYIYLDTTAAAHVVQGVQP
jgi:Cu(I)/Ag(I) efflux system membrane fusion protein